MSNEVWAALKRIGDVAESLARRVKALETLGRSNISAGGNNEFTGINRFGSSSDYTQIDASGHLTMAGAATVFDDVLPSSVTVGGGANAPAFTAYNGNLRAYEFVGSGPTQKDIHMGFQLPHWYKEGSEVFPHLHLYVPNDGSGGAIKFYCEFTWTNVNGVEGSTATYSGTLTIAAGAGNLHKILAINSSAFSGSGKTISSMLSCRFYRDPADAADTFGSSVWLKSADVHAEKDAMGSNTEYGK